MQILIDGKNPYSCNVSEIGQAFKVLKEAYRSAQQKVATKFYPGQKVSWDSRRSGGKMFGIILRVNRTSITIKPIDSPGKWKVSPSLLKLEPTTFTRKK